jgi:hypothetical protein
MKKITLRGGAVSIVDDEDFEYLSKMKWRNEKGYAKSGGAYNSVYMHRLIMNPPNDMQIDHKNNNPLDNRKVNLRIVTDAQNKYNTRMRDGLKKNKSGYKGVWKPKWSKKFIAEIRFEKKKYHLGSFSDKKEAAIAYDKKAIEFFGEYANLNILKLSDYLQ